MNEINQLKKLMEAIDGAGNFYRDAPYADSEGEPETYQNDEPFIQAHNLSGDNIIDKYKAGKISYEEAEDMLLNLHHDDGDFEMAKLELDAAYADTEVEWDEESGGGIAREGAFDGKISKLEHAKRLGSQLATDNERILEILLDDAELSPDFIRLISDAVDECIETRKLLAKI